MTDEVFVLQCKKWGIFLSILVVQSTVMLNWVRYKHSHIIKNNGCTAWILFGIIGQKEFSEWIIRYFKSTIDTSLFGGYRACSLPISASKSIATG